MCYTYRFFRIAGDKHTNCKRPLKIRLQSEASSPGEIRGVPEVTNLTKGVSSSGVREDEPIDLPLPLGAGSLIPNPGRELG